MKPGIKLVSNISVEEHARLVSLFVLVLTWIITAYLLKLYHSATVPLCDTVVLSLARHVWFMSIDASKWYWDVNSLYRNMTFSKCSVPVCSCIYRKYLFNLFVLQKNFLRASIELLTNFENASRNPPHNYLQCDWWKFTILSLAVNKIYLSQAAFGRILQDHRRLPACIFWVKIAAVRPVKRVQKGFLRLISYA